MIAKILLSTVFTISALSAQAGQDTNGGGGVYQDGQVMTFYSAGVVVKKEEETLASIPGLAEVMQEVYSMPYLTRGKALAYVSALKPGLSRHYYRVLQEHLDDQTLSRIVAEYRRITKLEKENIRLFAVTDSNSKTTYLFPDFYRLKKVEQMAILFHEGFWIVNPNSTYEKVVSAEIAAQKYLENSNDPENIMRFMAEIGTIRDYAKAGVALDLKSGALKPLLNKNGQLPLSTLLGSDTLACLDPKNQRMDMDCNSEFSYSLMSLSMQYPKSFFLKILAEKIESSSGLPLRGESEATELLAPTAADFPVAVQCRYLIARNSAVDLKVDESLKGFKIINSKVYYYYKDYRRDGVTQFTNSESCSHRKLTLILDEKEARQTFWSWTWSDRNVYY